MAERTVLLDATAEAPPRADSAPVRQPRSANRTPGAKSSRGPELPPKDRREVESIKWFHQIDLGNGIITPGMDTTRTRLEMLSLPGDLRGRSVLDICAWDGAFSFEAERLGANRVMAVDSFCWSGGGWGTKRGFECARRLLQSRVEDREVEVMDLSPETVGGTYDLVLFLGVLYHMKHPLAALERVASVCANQLILWTHINLAHLDVPAMAFYPDCELADDPTNWWGPNPSAIAGMLQAVGFSRVENVNTWLDDGSRKKGTAIFHAWRDTDHSPDSRTPNHSAGSAPPWAASTARRR